MPPPSPTPRTSLFTPGRPYEPADILEAMATTPRPDGVPSQLQTDAIAASVAAAIWTFDGAPWDTIVAEGTCGEACTLEVAGTRDGTDSEDLWIFTIDPSSGAVNVMAAEARAIPEVVAAELDEIVRALDPAGRLDGMALTSVAWQPPPDEGRFALSYRSGGEEGSCSAELLIDARDGRVLDESFSEC
jgi:hypothetical protein